MNNSDRFVHAIILAGGKGTSFDQTDCIPKALVSVGGKPILGNGRQ